MANLFNSFKNVIAKKYGNQPGEMLVHTGVIGWILSAIAQIVAVSVNDKIPKEKKAFMIPQEAADAAVNILSFYAITRTCKALANKLVISGKILPKNIRQHLKLNNIEHTVKNFDTQKCGKLTPELEYAYDKFYKGIDVIGTTIGAILSCNIVTPLIRNQFASSRQQVYIAKVNEEKKKNNPYANFIATPSLHKFASGNGLKV